LARPTKERVAAPYRILFLVRNKELQRELRIVLEKGLKDNSLLGLILPDVLYESITADFDS